MIKIALVGYGKMGKMIEQIISQERDDFIIDGIYDIENPVSTDITGKPDVAIEFTTPSEALNNIGFLASRGINIVCGTTGWYSRLPEVKEIIDKSGTGFIYASNFSIGVNLFFQIVKYSSGLINNQSQYDISIEETHHTQKLDKPSGTALRIAEYIMDIVKRKNMITNDKASSEHNELNITSDRKPEVVGNHRVIYDSPADSIIIEHNAKSRIGFAEGALLAAKFINKKKGFYRFEDIFLNLIK